jgi:hypothetical protein
MKVIIFSIYFYNLKTFQNSIVEGRFLNVRKFRGSDMLQ